MKASFNSTATATATAIVALALAALLPQAAHADDEGRFYALAGFGTARTDLGAAEDYYRAQADNYLAAGALKSEPVIDDSSSTFAAGFGYWLHPALALEGYYRDFGRAEAGVSATFTGSASSDVTDYRASGFGVGLLGLVAVGEWFSLYGRADLVNVVTRYESFGSASFPGGSGYAAGDDTALQAGFGLGGQYDFRHGISLRVDWQRMEAPFGQRGLDGEMTIDSLNVFLLKSL
ncbi:MAG: ompA-like transrane domain protein [Moraxellaceae bacterium]|nr:ompA-like transrane domain protein [Moraxellaceae bacterium]